jgi:selenide,water dikinase
MLAAAYKRGISTNEQNDALHELLTQNNSIGYELGKIKGVNAMTDITGFGLVGHLLETCKSSNLGAEIEFANVPIEPEAIALAASFVLPDNAMRNWNAYEKEVQISNQDAFAWVVDPQTNGGLLFTVSEAFVMEVKDLFNSKNLPLYEIGKIVNSRVVVR